MLTALERQGYPAPSPSGPEYVGDGAQQQVEVGVEPATSAFEARPTRRIGEQGCKAAGSARTPPRGASTSIAILRLTSSEIDH